jgi:tetratricopeptide (TPR) repeat protein
VAGRWLEESHSEDLQRYYDTLAHHFDRGEEWTKAFHYHWLAGARDAHVNANQSALFHLGRALELAGQAAPDSYALAQVHFELGRVLVTTGEFDDALEHLQAAYGLFGDAGAQGVLPSARVCYEIGRIHELRGENLALAWEWQRKGLASLPETPTAEAALLHVLGGVVSLRGGDWDRLATESERAIDLAETTNARLELAFAHRLLSVFWRAQGDLDRAMTHCQEGVQASEALSDLLGLIKGYSNQGVIAFEMDDWPLAQSSYLQAVDLLERVGDKYELGRAYCNLGDLYFHLGDLEGGLAYAQQGLDIALEMRANQGIIIARTVLAALLWRKRDLEEALAQLLEAEKLTERLVVFKPTVGRWLAQVHLTRGKLNQAEAVLQGIEVLGANVLADEAAPIQRLRGQVLAAQGELDEAIQVLEASLERLEGEGMRYQTAGALLALAGAFSQMEDGALEARSHAERARAIFQDLGAMLDLREAEELLRKTAGRGELDFTDG